MPTQKFALERGETPRLELSWGFNWKNFEVRFDGTTLGTIEGGIRAVREGRDFTLPDGTTVTVKLVSQMANTAPELQVLRNGKPLPGSASDPEVRLRNAYNIIYVIAGLNIILGIVTAVGKIDFLLDLGLGWPSVIFGLIYVGLGYLTSKRSRLALGAAVAIFVLDGLIGFVLNSAATGTPAVGGIVVRIFLVYGMIQGFSAINALNQEGL